MRTTPKTRLSVVIHSTNGNKGSSYAAEKNYIYNSYDISAHFLIGKDGTITQFLPLKEYRAWHAGLVNDQTYSNENSIGIECHYTPGENTNLPLMYKALTDLVQYLKTAYQITGIQTHRAIAIPKGRKIDPSFWTDQEFADWKASLDQTSIINVDIPLINAESVNLETLLSITHKRAPQLDTKTIHELCSGYTALGRLTGLGNLWPYAQAWHETGIFTSARFLESNNCAGLGADDSGAWGVRFETITHGIMAQMAHLLCYAKKPTELTPLQLQLSMLSPRRDILDRAHGLGCASNSWIGLNRKWNSPKATETGYTDAIQSVVNYIKAGT